jgi:hypothetical protein
VLYVLALIGLITVIAVLWATVGPRHVPDRRPRGLAPDDDPEFLRRLGERRPPEE